MELSTFSFRVQLQAVFLQCQGPASCCFREVRSSSFSQSLQAVLESISAVAGVFWKHRGEETRTPSEISKEPPLSRGEVFQRSQCPFKQQFTLIITLPQFVYASGVSPQKTSQISHRLNFMRNNICSRSYISWNVFCAVRRCLFFSFSLPKIRSHLM